MAVLAINGGSPVRRVPFPPWPVWDQRERAALLEALESDVWGGIGSEHVRAFGQAFAAAHDARYGVPVMNGTTALQVGLQAVGVRWGEEVIVPALTWIATAQVAVYLGAVPVFCDIDPETYTLDPQQLDTCLSSRTRAIIPVHYGGRPADLEAVLAFARQHDLAVIEDCAHAHGAQWRGRGVGSWGDLGAFSFQQSKVITCGEGGCLLTSDQRLAELCASIINCGRIQADDRYLVEHPFNYNFRMTAFQAALLVVQLTRLTDLTLRRQAAADFLDSALGRIEGIRPVRRDPRITRRAYYLYIVRYEAKAFGGLPREVFLRALRAEGIPAGGDADQLVYRNPLYAVTTTNCCALAVHASRPDRRWEGRCPQAERAVAQEMVVLPQNVLLADQDGLADIVRAVKKIQAHRHELSTT